MTSYKSEIRTSDIQALEDKVASEKYGQYLKRITLKRVRGFTDRVVSFDFPVTALVGPNGGGKTTILGAAGLAYKSVAPGRFFAKSGRYDPSMRDWSLEYELIDRAVNPRALFRTLAVEPVELKRGNGCEAGRKLAERPAISGGENFPVLEVRYAAFHRDADPG